jgi:hypothetical protein
MKEEIKNNAEFSLNVIVGVMIILSGLAVIYFCAVGINYLMK